jgi:hypothetical protein
LATFEEHITHATKNLHFLTETNLKNQSFWDWQVTVSFYVAVHMVNAHLAIKGGLHYRTHEDVKNALNPYNDLAICRIEESVYLAYTKLEMLSRRARYLCHENKDNKSDSLHFTHDRHFAKAIRNLDKILDHFKKMYTLSFPAPHIFCQDLSNSEELKIFKVQVQNLA